jgi:hypothetical protein
MPVKKRLNIILPETTVRTIDRMAKPGERSLFIDQAIQHFVTHRSTEALRDQLERAVVRDRDLDREITNEWVAADQELWKQLDTAESQKRGTRGAAKSTLQRSTRR